MQDATVGSQDTPTAGYSLQEAAALLGIGVNTLRRRIAAGQIRGERVQRPQGYVWRVYLDSQHPPNQPTSHPADQEAPRSLPHPPAQLAQAEALASLIQATLTPIIAPLVAQIEAHRQTVERQADQLVSQAETIGELRATVAAQEARIATQNASGSTHGPEPSTNTWRPWLLPPGPIRAAVVVIAFAAVLLFAFWWGR